MTARGCCLCVCLQLCTLSASGGDLLNAFPAGGAPLFDVVVVDEAAQALEPATLIPLQLIKPGEECQIPQHALQLVSFSTACTAWLFCWDCSGSTWAQAGACGQP